MFITCEVRGKTIDIPIVHELPNGKYRKVQVEKKYTICQEINTFEYFAVNSTWLDREDDT